MKTCTEGGCSKNLVARGLCSTHYNRKHQPSRHKPKTRPCAWCGAPVTGSGGGGRKYGAACDTRCRRYLAVATPSSAREMIHQPRTPRADQRPRRTTPTRLRWFAGSCQVCATAFVSPHFEKTCSDACADLKRRGDKSEAEYRRRATLRRAHTSPVNRHAIFRRDDWTCWLCHLPVDMGADPQSDHAPSIDHIIPLANGGTHEPANAATAHRVCNSRRTNRPTLTSRTGERVPVLF